MWVNFGQNKEYFDYLLHIRSCCPIKYGKITKNKSVFCYRKHNIKSFKEVLSQFFFLACQY